jgi:hypothetical protein
MTAFLEKLNQAREAIGSVLAHDAKGHYGKYTSLPAVLKAIDGPLRDAGLTHITEIIDGQLTVRLTDDTGEGIEAFFPLPFDQPPEKVGAAISYFRRYGLGLLVGFATDSDVDTVEYQSQADQPHPADDPEMYAARLINHAKATVVELVGPEAAADAWLELMSMVGMDPDNPAIKTVKDRDYVERAARQHWSAA